MNNVRVTRPLVTELLSESIRIAEERGASSTALFLFGFQDWNSIKTRFLPIYFD